MMVKIWKCCNYGWELSFFRLTKSLELEGLGNYDVSMRIIFLQVNDRFEGSGWIYITSMQSSLFFAGVFARCKCLCQHYGGAEEDGAILTTIEIKGWGSEGKSPAPLMTHIIVLPALQPSPSPTLCSKSRIPYHRSRVACIQIANCNFILNIFLEGLSCVLSYFESPDMCFLSHP